MQDHPLAEAPYPLQRHIGFRMLDWTEGFARFVLPMQEFILNRHGIPHGGIHAMMLDTVMGYSGCWTGDPERRVMAMTLSLTVNYLGQAKGDMIAEGRQTGGGRRTFFAEGKVMDADGTPVATASGVFRYRGEGRT